MVSGLRLAEAIALHIRDIDFERREIIVCNQRTGAKDRTTVLPDSIIPVLQRHLAEVKFLYEDDCLLGYNKTYLPDPVYRKYHNIGYEWHWQYVFPSYKLTTDEKNRTFSRYHLAESTVQKAVSEAIKKAEISKQACCQTLRHSFAVRLFERNYDIRRIQNLLGHKNLKTTRIYMQFAGSSRNVVQSPLDI